MQHDKTIPQKTANGFVVPESDRQKKNKAAKDASGTVNQRIEAKLDYIMLLLEEGEK